MKTKFINEGEDQYFIEREGLGNFAKKNHEKQNRARGAMGKNRASALCYPGSVFQFKKFLHELYAENHTQLKNERKKE